MVAPRRIKELSGTAWSGLASSVTRLATPASAFAVALWRKYVADEIGLRAMSLVYTTILSLVPFLAVTFSVLKAFGVQNQVEPMLAQALSPLGADAAEISRRVVAFVNNLRVGVLGAFGVAGLLYTAVSLVGTIENSLNHIWSARQGRTLAVKFRDYLSVIMVAPVLTFSALALTASAQSQTLVQRALELAPFLTVLATRFMPHLILAAGFTLLYKFLPTARVSWRAALIGGIVAGVGWKLAGTAFAAFVAGSGRYAAIYSSFAIVILFLVWLYVSWLIVLVGGEVAYFCQYPYLAGAAHLRPCP
jgi:membrane protein